MGAVNHAKLSSSAIVLVATLFVCAGMYAASFRLARVIKINTTDSMPIGIYVMRSDTIAPGRIVVACPPEAAARIGLENGYLEHGSCTTGAAPVLKYVAATGGSHVAVTDSGILINGRLLDNSVARRNDHRGRVIPHVHIGTYRLGEDEVWLYSPASWSWDSRYFGPISTKEIVGSASPLLIMPRRTSPERLPSKYDPASRRE